MAVSAGRGASAQDARPLGERALFGAYARGLPYYPHRALPELERKLGVKLGQSTADGRIYLKHEDECVAACCGAPVMMVNGHYHEKLTPEKVDEILDGLE